MLLATIGRTLDELGSVNHKMLSRAGSRLALLALMAGAKGIAFAPIFVRVSEVGPVTTAFYRLLFALPVLWLWSSIERNSNQTALLPQSAGDYRDLALAGLLFAADLAVWHWSIHLTSIANTTLLANASPIFVTVGARLLFSERIYPAFVLGMLLAFSGGVIQYRHRVLALVAGRSGEFIEDPPFVVPTSLAIPGPKTGDQFMSCCLTHPMPHYVRYSPFCQNR
jgi:uncharacterized membrane protein